MDINRITSVRISYIASPCSDNYSTVLTILWEGIFKRLPHFFHPQVIKNNSIPFVEEMLFEYLLQKNHVVGGSLSDCTTEFLNQQTQDIKCGFGLRSSDPSPSQTHKRCGQESSSPVLSSPPQT